MSERLSLTLLVCLTMLGLFALHYRQENIVTAVVVALGGLMVTWGQSLKPVLAKVDEVHQLVNSQKAALVAEVADLKAQLAAVLPVLPLILHDPDRPA